MFIYNANRSGRKHRPGISLQEDQDEYLIEIDEDRYGGSYSDAAYTAWCGIRPDDINAGDPPCGAFWDEWKDKAFYGVGDTPQQAFRDLTKKIDDVGIYSVDTNNPSQAPLKVIMIHWCGTAPQPLIYDSADFRTWISQDTEKPIRRI